MIEDFKTYLAKRKQLQEEIDTQNVNTREPATELSADKPEGSIQSIVTSYIKDDPKEGLKKLGDDIGKAIVYFAMKEYVTYDMFDSDAEQQAYEKIIRDKIEESYNKTLIELFRNIGVTLVNTKVSNTN